jgi:hypothetical protein
MKMHRIIIGALLALMPLAVLVARPTVHLSVPPPDRYGIEDLWKATLNSDTTCDTARFEGWVLEATHGQVFHATSKPFQLPRGTKVYGYRDVKIEHTDVAPGYEAFVTRSGHLPAGNYRFRLVLQPFGVGDSNRFEVRERQPVRLISPPNGQAVTSPNPTFVWTAPPGEPTPSEINYVLGVKRVNPGQSSRQAWNTNPWFHVIRDIRTTSLQWPTSAPAFDSGSNYVWALKWHPRGTFPWPWPWPDPLPWNYAPFPEPDTFLFLAPGGGHARPPAVLIAPADGASLAVESLPTFVWSLPRGVPNPNELSYVLALKRVLSGQSPDEAWAQNEWHNAIRDIRDTTFKYQPGASPLDSGEAYVWAVKYYAPGRFPWPWPFPRGPWRNYAPIDTHGPHRFVVGPGGGDARPPARLIAPADGAILAVGVPPTFTWNYPYNDRPKGRGDFFVIGIKEVKPGQTRGAAWEGNPWFFTARDIDTNSFAWPADAPSLHTGGTYIWAVKWYPRDGKFPWHWPLPDIWYNYVSIDTLGPFQFVVSSGGVRPMSNALEESLRVVERRLGIKARPDKPKRDSIPYGDVPRERDFIVASKPLDSKACFVFGFENGSEAAVYIVELPGLAPDESLSAGRHVVTARLLNATGNPLVWRRPATDTMTLELDLCWQVSWVPSGNRREFVDRPFMLLQDRNVVELKSKDVIKTRRTAPVGSSWWDVLIDSWSPAGSQR